MNGTILAYSVQNSSGLTHISHINPAWRAVISNIGDRCNRIAEHSGYHEC